MMHLEMGDLYERSRNNQRRRLHRAVFGRSDHLHLKKRRLASKRRKSPRQLINRLARNRGLGSGRRPARIMTLETFVDERR